MICYKTNARTNANTVNGEIVLHLLFLTICLTDTSYNIKDQTNELGDSLPTETMQLKCSKQ